MKKNRPGTLMTIVASRQREAMTEIVFRETTTIGVRHQELSRECLDREMVTVTTRSARCASRWRAATAVC